MIADPYICTDGLRRGAITWFSPLEYDGKTFTGAVFSVRNSTWQSYADFEREKLRELNSDDMQTCESGYTLLLPHKDYTSQVLLGYSHREHAEDSESSRLLKRAEFLKAVCEKEGVRWLPDAPKEEEEGAHFECGCDVKCGGCGACRHQKRKLFCFFDHYRYETEPCSHTQPDRDYYTKAETDQAIEKWMTAVIEEMSLPYPEQVKRALRRRFGK